MNKSASVDSEENVSQCVADENVIRVLFNQFDTNQDGAITLDELKSMMKSLFPSENLTDHDFKHMLDEADLNQNGTIDYKGSSKAFSLFIYSSI